MYHAWKARNRTSANNVNGLPIEEEMRTPHSILVEASKLAATIEKDVIAQEHRYFRVPFTRHEETGTEVKGW